jgi:hypothetical protein
MCAGGSGPDDHDPPALYAGPGPDPTRPRLPGPDDHPPPPHPGGRRPVRPEAGGGNQCFVSGSGFDPCTNGPTKKKKVKKFMF